MVVDTFKRLTDVLGGFTHTHMSVMGYPYVALKRNSPYNIAQSATRCVIDYLCRGSLDRPSANAELHRSRPYYVGGPEKKDGSAVAVGLADQPIDKLCLVGNPLSSALAKCEHGRLNFQRGIG